MPNTKKRSFKKLQGRKQQKKGFPVLPVVISGIALAAIALVVVVAYYQNSLSSGQQTSVQQSSPALGESQTPTLDATQYPLTSPCGEEYLGYDDKQQGDVWKVTCGNKVYGYSKFSDDPYTGWVVAQVGNLVLDCGQLPELFLSRGKKSTHFYVGTCDDVYVIVYEGANHTIDFWVIPMGKTRVEYSDKGYKVVLYFEDQGLVDWTIM